MYLNVRCLICVFKAFLWKIRQGNNALTDITIWIISILQLLCRTANLVSYHSHIAKKYTLGDKHIFLISKYSIVKLIIHIVILLSLSERGSLRESRMLLRRNLNSYMNTQPSCVNPTWKIFICYSFLISCIIMDTIHVSIAILNKTKPSLSLPVQWNYL